MTVQNKRPTPRQTKVADNWAVSNEDVASVMGQCNASYDPKAFDDLTQDDIKRIAAIADNFEDDDDAQDMADYTLSVILLEKGYVKTSLNKPE